METDAKAAGGAQKGEHVDVEADKHAGQIALRKLYHESPRVLMVLYTAKTCGPCRTLKPIVNAVVDEYKGQVTSMSFS